MSDVKYRIFRYPNGISLNGKEFICEEDQEVKLFDTVLDASKWLTENIEEGKPSKNGIFLLSEETLEEEYGIYIEADIPENGYMPIEREVANAE